MKDDYGFMNLYTNKEEPKEEKKSIDQLLAPNINMQVQQQILEPAPVVPDTTQKQVSTASSPLNNIAVNNTQTTAKNKKEIIRFEDVVKEYKNGEIITRALNKTNLTIYEGDVVIFLGTSGAGKSTALNSLGGLDQVTSGHIYVDGEDITQYNEKQLLKYRREKIGFIFQFYNLVQTLTAKDNVELALELCKDKKYKSEVLLEQVGLKDRINNFPSQMSGGEQQRVSIARALAKSPRILLADEPTGALDYNTTRQVLELLVGVCKQNNVTLIIVTHNNFITPIADVVYSFRSGDIISVERQEHPLKVGELPW